MDDKGGFDWRTRKGLIGHLSQAGSTLLSSLPGAFDCFDFIIATCVIAKCHLGLHTHSVAVNHKRNDRKH